jgi:hypothetical protein
MSQYLPFRPHVSLCLIFTLKLTNRLYIYGYKTVESLHLKRKTRVPVTSAAIKYKAWKHSKLQAIQHHSHHHRLVCIFGGDGLVLSPVKGYAVPEMNLYNIFVRNEGHTQTLTKYFIKFDIDNLYEGCPQEC